MHDISFWRIAISDFENRKSLNISEWIHRAICKNATHLLIRESNLSISELVHLSDKVNLELNNQLTQKNDFQNRIRLIINFSKSIEEYFKYPELHNYGLHLKSNSPYSKVDFIAAFERINKIRHCELNESNTEFILGRSCHSKTEVIQAQMKGFDYVFLSPIFSTRSHPDTSCLGLEKLEEAAKSVVIPVIALGGINEDNAEACKLVGANGFAGISWIFD